MLEIYTRIKQRREELGMSQDELAQKMGYKSRSSIAKIENGDNDIPQSKIVAFAKALETTPGKLMGLGEVVGKVTSKTTIAFGDNGPIHDLYQYYIRRPKAVQDEIIDRLKGLDNTFSQNIKHFLTEGASMDELIRSSGINVTTFLSLLKDQPASPTPEEAEKIATYFQQDVCDMFFEDLSKGPTNNTPVKKPTKVIPDNPDIDKTSSPMESSVEYGFYANKLLEILKSRNKSFDITIFGTEIQELLTLPNFESVVKKAIKEFYNQPDLDDANLFRNLAILLERDHAHISRLMNQDKLKAAADYINEQLKDTNQFLGQ